MSYNKYYLADRDTHSDKIQKVNGKFMLPVGILPSKRKNNPKPKEVFYHWEGTREIYIKKGAGYWSPANSKQDMEMFYQLFCEDPLTPKEERYCNLYGVQLL